MKLLAIETATEACSVALWIDGDVRERFEVAPRQHSGLVLPWADALLAEAPVLVIDPEPGNLRAIRAYEKAGFRPVPHLLGRTGDGVLIMQFDPNAKETT